MSKSITVNPFMGFHTNFDPDTGNLTEPGWSNKEIILIEITDDLEKAQATDIHVHFDGENTIVTKDRSACHQISGDIFDPYFSEASYWHLLIEISDIDKLVGMSKEFFRKNIGEFETDDSPLGVWFDSEARAEVLMDDAFQKVLDEGLFSHLLPIIYTPFTKDVFQRGEVTEDTIDLFTRAIKRKLKKA